MNIKRAKIQLSWIDRSKKKEQDCYVGPQLVRSLYLLKIPFKIIFSNIGVAEALHFKTSSLVVYVSLSGQDHLTGCGLQRQSYFLSLFLTGQFNVTFCFVVSVYYS